MFSIGKALLPVYDKPMVYYPLSILMSAGIQDVMIISSSDDEALFKKLLEDGSKLGINIEYRVQKEQRGIADAFLIAEDFIANDSVCLVLGDNIIFGPSFQSKLSRAVQTLKGATIFGYQVSDPRAFGVIEFDEFGKVVSIEEKPSVPKSNYIVPGLYFYDNSVIKIAHEVKPSLRGELEITSVNEAYAKDNNLSVIKLGDEFSWFDAGNADSLHEATQAIKIAQENSGSLIGCIEEIAMINGWITVDQLKEYAKNIGEFTIYGRYIQKIVEHFDNNL